MTRSLCRRTCFCMSLCLSLCLCVCLPVCSSVFVCIRMLVLCNRNVTSLWSLKHHVSLCVCMPESSVSSLLWCLSLCLRLCVCICVCALALCAMPAKGLNKSLFPVLRAPFPHPVSAYYIIRGILTSLALHSSCRGVSVPQALENLVSVPPAKMKGSGVPKVESTTRRPSYTRPLSLTA